MTTPEIVLCKICKDPVCPCSARGVSDTVRAWLYRLVHPGFTELKQRVSDQPLPIKNDYPVIQDLVMADIEERKKLGIARYGTTLQPFNGRDVLKDIYEELLDAAIYMRQLAYERDKK